MTLTYLASPFSHMDESVRDVRFRAVCAVAARMMGAGAFVFSPIAHTVPIADIGKMPTDFAYWAAYDRRMIATCDDLTVLMLDGWRESVGVQAEIAIASEMGKPVIYMEYHDDE